MSRRLGFFITQREYHSWNVYSDEIVEAHNEVRVEVRYPGKGLIGRLTSPPDGKPHKYKRRPPDHELDDLAADRLRAEVESVKVRAVAIAEKAHAKALKLSGNRFEVKDRDGHPRGYFPQLPPAQARADEVGGFVTDRLEGLIVYSAAGDPDRDAIPYDGEVEG